MTEKSRVRPIRTRFAPSPTGQLHIGNARTAIMNWAFTRQAGGAFVLRIEDTDRERSTEASERSILEDLRWLGLDWDEGPDIGGPYGPYRQSERLGLYADYRELLLRSGRVYPCYCTPEELEARRRDRLSRGEVIHYDGRCRHLTQEEKRRFEAEGRRPAYRFHAEEPFVAFDDLIRGEIRVPGEQIGDFIIARADGMPMYNFACAIDDHLMGISHIIRGDDHISNTPRQILIYRALGWDPPHFSHIPMILGKDRQRLSKRHGATSVRQYRENGFLPEALVNYLSLLSWSPESGEEIFSRDELIRMFDFGRISRSPAVFDPEKLSWMNGVYIRRLDPEDFAQRLLPFVRKAGYPVPDAETLKPMAVLFQEKIETLSDIGERLRFFFEDPIPRDDPTWQILMTDQAQAVLSAFLAALDGMASLDRLGFQTLMKTIQEKTGCHGKDLWMPVRVALTGQMHGPDLAAAAEILGIDRCRRRVRAALRHAHGEGSPSQVHT